MSYLRAYHRPSTLAEALELLGRTDVSSVPLGGGTVVGAAGPHAPEEVVDLQALGLDSITADGTDLEIGAMVRLQALVDHEHVPPLLRDLAHREEPNTLRNAATVGGLVATADPQSALLAGLLVCDAAVSVATASGGTEQQDLAVLLRDGIPAGGLVTSIRISWQGDTASEWTARTPSDRPIVAAVGRRDDDGATRVAVTGVAATPTLIDPDDVASLDPPGDFRGSPEYRRHLAAVLTARVLARLDGEVPA
jgi:CO/xanthine dehydrogenase FAD-binding subunit